ncbi:MAG: hypothetical protein U0361_20785 [Nitrospiraceae bacterium]
MTAAPDKRAWSRLGAGSDRRYHFFYYLLPDEWQAFWPIQFFPQVCAYVA